MRTRLDKTIDLIADKKQMTLGEPVGPIETPVKKKTKPTGPTYWVCVKGHIFEHKYQVHQNRIDDIHCPLCGSKTKNKSTRTSYEWYRKQTGRADELKWRQKKAREAERKLNKFGGQ